MDLMGLTELIYSSAPNPFDGSLTRTDSCWIHRHCALDFWHLTSQFWRLLNVYCCHNLPLFLSFGFAFFVIYVLPCHGCCHFAVIFVVWFCILLWYSCCFFIRRGWLDPEPTWKVQKRYSASTWAVFCISQIGSCFCMFFAHFLDWVFIFHGCFCIPN